MAGNYTIVTTQGDTWNFNATVETDGVAWNFTGYTAKMQVKESTSALKKYLDLASGDEITLDAYGKIYIVVSATVMATVPPGRWVYDLEVTSSGGERTTLLEGNFVVSPQVTV